MTLAKTILALASASLFFPTGPGRAQQPDAAKMLAKPSAADLSFANNAAESGLLEIKLGQLAFQKASNAQVKQFGMRMVDDHSMIGDKLRELAAKDNFIVPDQVNPKDQATVDRLNKLSGAELDRALMTEMATDHEQAVSLFQREAEGGTNFDLKNFAKTTLPTLQAHLSQAKRLENAVGAVSRK
jgi:putative membrane protein